MHLNNTQTLGIESKNDRRFDKMRESGSSRRVIDFAMVPAI